MTNEEIASFLQARSEAARWCDLEGHRSAYRTPALQPDVPRWPTQAQFDRILETLRQRRLELLGRRAIGPEPAGRLVACEVNESVSSGESEFATAGFFDIDDRPPWDTWFWRFESEKPEHVTLVSWVPQAREASVMEGIYVNPYDCIQWFADIGRLWGRSPDAIQALVRAGVR
jgi:hypothetical protein